MTLTRADIDRLVDWGRVVFHEDDWSIEDDRLLEKLQTEQVQRASPRPLPPPTPLEGVRR